MKATWRVASGVVVLHIIGIWLLFQYSSQSTVLFGLGLLAYTFGLRHAFDVDHIAFIDNTVRKFLHEHRRPYHVGFLFSLGHATVVMIMCIGTVFAVHAVQQHLPILENVGGILSTVISGLFLVALAIVNCAVWKQMLDVFRRIRRDPQSEHDLDKLLQQRGMLSRIIGPLSKMITKTWHVYFIGFLFGLGFDTASEIALLAISASASHRAVPWLGILSLPALFAAGMSLMDTADGIFMVNAYEWAFSNPLRKIYYNLSVTGLGVLAASAIGIIELLQVLVRELHLQGGLWTSIQQLNFGTMGYILVALFVIVWVLSFGVWKLLKLDALEQVNRVSRRNSVG